MYYIWYLVYILLHNVSVLHGTNLALSVLLPFLTRRESYELGGKGRSMVVRQVGDVLGNVQRSCVLGEHAPHH